MKKNDLETLKKFPIALVARGTLAPKYLRWVRENWADDQIYVVNFSRWRYFDGVEESVCRWITPPPAGVKKVVVFDRSITTGLTFRYLNQWFSRQGIETINLGEMDTGHCRLGICWTDCVWENGEVFSKTEWLKSHEISGDYTIAVFGARPEFADFPIYCLLSGSFESIARQMDSLPKKGSVIIKYPEQIDLAMLGGYILERPLITVAGKGCKYPADFADGENIQELVEFLNKR